jgi:hypothetical protein
MEGCYLKSHEHLFLLMSSSLMIGMTYMLPAPAGSLDKAELPSR